jgi:hypothetical protein
MSRNNIRFSGPSTHQKSYPASFQEHDSLFGSYEHLMDCPQPEEALIRLRKIASLVKPLMRKRSWKVNVLTEFLPDDQRLLGLNINKTFKICVRLRYTHSPGTFLPIEECVDTLLHELSHIVFGHHDSNFHALWDELRDDHEILLSRGYTGEGFLTGGKRLGGAHVPPQQEIRRLARANAEKRRVLQNASGRTLGGQQNHPSPADLRKTLANAAERRATADRGCASGTAKASDLADQAGRRTFKTQAEEDDANNRAIAEALFDLLEEEETRINNAPASEEEQMKQAINQSLQDGQSRKRPLSVGSDNDPIVTKIPPSVRPRPSIPIIDLTEDDHDETPTKKPTTNVSNSHWACRVCTCINSLKHLACDACGTERPTSRVQATKPSVAIRTASSHSKTTRPTALSVGKETMKKETAGWNCRECGTFVEHKWWCCTLCGLMKDRS